MSAEYKMGVHIATDDPMRLPEKVMEFVKAQGWSGEVVTLEQALGCQERNIADYMIGYKDAEKFMNEHYAEGGGMGGSGTIWRASSDESKWGLTEGGIENPLDEDQEVQICGVNEKEDQEPPISQTNEPF